MHLVDRKRTILSRIVVVVVVIIVVCQKRGRPHARLCRLVAQPLQILGRSLEYASQLRGLVELFFAG